MQMESWRERGFVPDSDDEDGFDSQDAKTVDTDSQRRGGISGTIPVQTEAGTNSDQEEPIGVVGRDGTRRDSLQSIELAQGAECAILSNQGEEIELPSHETQPEQKGEDLTALDQPDVVDDGAGEDTPRAREGNLKLQASEGLSEAIHDESPSTPQARRQRDVWDIPSSPDLLQIDHRPWRKQITFSRKTKVASQRPPQGKTLGSSPLSSPPSSLHSPSLEANNQETEKEPGDDLEEQPSDKALEDLLPPLDIPEDILQELVQPARRSLRQRNPIQLHPYLLEDARYQRLMRARGLKPVRVAQHLQSAPPEANESQSQELGDEAGASSDTQMTDFQFPPSSPMDTRQLLEITPVESSGGNRNLQRSPRPKPPRSSAGEPRSPKRRRVLGPEDGSRRRDLPLPRPMVLVNNLPSPRRPDVTSVFDIPSPPRSGSISPQNTRPFTGFRFPRGFSPTVITPNTEPRNGIKDVDNAMNPIADESVDAVDNDLDGIRSTSSHSRSGSDVEEEERDVNEAVVRKLQRKIKGVLPASWLRLDQQKQKEERLTAARQNQERLSRMEAENTKGVARKITKRADSVVVPDAREQLFSLRHLAEDSSEESAQDSDHAESVESRQPPPKLFEFEDSVLGQGPDGDIPEDNRIDYMLPTISRHGSLFQGRKRDKKRRRLEANNSRSDIQSKKPRLKRQARLTDAVYGGQKRKQPLPNFPKLGVLDAPDVVSRPRNEQPQFLRIAARKARSRLDKGRRSPSQKVFKLSSRLDTEDANASLREWRTGRLKPTNLPRVSNQTLRRPPLIDLSTNKRDAPSDRVEKSIGESHMTRPIPAVQLDENRAGSGNTPALAIPSSDPTSKAPSGSSKPVRPQVRGNTWTVRRNFAVSSLNRNTPRPAVPEAPIPRGASGSLASFQRSLALLNRDFGGQKAARKQKDNLLLDRFLSGSAVGGSSELNIPELDKSNDASHSKPQVERRQRQLKKRPPTRLDVGTTEGHLPFVSPSPNIELPTPVTEASLPLNRSSPGISGLKPTYSVDFNASPLYPGIFYHESTFIGSGEFSHSLNISGRDLDKSTGLFHIQISDRSLRWGSWDDAVSSEFGVAFDRIIRETEGPNGNTEEAALDTGHSASTLYRSLIKYLSDVLAFIDPIDRAGFIARAIGLISRLIDALSNVVSTATDNMERLMKISSYNLVFANQICQIADHNLVNPQLQKEGLDLAKSASRQVTAFVSSPAAQESIRKFLAAGKDRGWRDAGIKDDHPAVDAYVIIQHVLRSAHGFKGSFEDILADTSLLDTEDSHERDVHHLETGWLRLFTFLPLQEIDELGIAQVGLRFKGGHDNWTEVKRLLGPVLDSRDTNSGTQPVLYYNYCRVLFHRCFILINGWGWRDCKPILDTLYDFFAKRTLYNLKHEESYKSPSFLDQLDGNPSFEVLPGDPCFHILLKIIASGLRFLSKVYDKKKIRNFAWRLLPNHGRVYPKEQSIHQADLDALRNHHDLLCTLYSSVPDGCRPRLETIRNLVHPATSHRETCNISLRSWTRLVRFKLATNEDVSGLEPFANWHCYFVTEFVKQHNLARKEVEAQNSAGQQFPQQLIERTIAQNQRQIESLLKTALQSLQSAIKASPTLEHAQKIVSETPIKAILSLFNPKIARLNATVSEALQMIVMYVQKCNSLPSGVPAANTENLSPAVDDDSQEYGDWADIEAVYGDEFSPVSLGVEHVEKVFHPAVSRLVSNCFGEDQCPEDAILLSVLECWTSIAQTLVKHRLRRWDTYLSPYDGDSWVALRSTTQTRKFTPQFLASCIEKDGLLLSECKIQILGMWLSSLVERVSMLKYQHRLTEALLNQDVADPVLQNLPFSRSENEGCYSITLEDLSQRRLSLISSLLSNMRVHIQTLDDIGSKDLLIVRQDYRELIQKMMSSMKANYQELGNGAASIQGTYVDFVHRIVGFLQQHTRDICPIDPFFTDPASFPLPSTDPTYIVARLKSYEPKLSSEKVAKTLIIFIQGVSERAAIDGEQTYLVSQLHASMADTYEAGNPDQPTLRAILLQCVFPAYLETTFNNPAAWVLSRPIISTVSLVFKVLLFNLDTTDTSCVGSVTNIFHSIFVSSYTALRLIMQDPDMLTQPTVLVTAAALLEMATSALQVVDYIDRATDIDETIITDLHVFQRFAIFAIAHLQNRPLPHEPPPIFPPRETTSISTTPTSPPFIHNISHSATRELQAYIAESWSRHQGTYYFTRRGGHPPQEVKIEPGIAAQLEDLHLPTTSLLYAAQDFLDSLAALDLSGDSTSTY